jgi:hypothetical protein
MLQIVHDLAPKADLAFATGFLSAGHMAQSIYALKEAGCKVIVDDVTYITEPFFQDGIIARTVNEVSRPELPTLLPLVILDSGLHQYFPKGTCTCRPYGFAHDFGGGDTTSA